MVVKLPQFSFPVTTPFLVAAENLEPIQWLLKALVGEIIEVVLFTARTRIVVAFNYLNALLAEAFSTAGHLVRLSKDMDRGKWDMKFEGTVVDLPQTHTQIQPGFSVLPFLFF